MYRERFTNEEWNSLNWKSTGFKIGENYIDSCYQVAERLGYTRTNKRDYFEHDLYTKDGKIYFIENRNSGIEIALADFKGEYIEETYRNEKNKILYSGELVKNLVKQNKYRQEDFKLIGRKLFLFTPEGKVEKTVTI